MFHFESSIYIAFNNATSGGGVYLTQSNLAVFNDLSLTSNKATDFGGGI